MAQNTRKEFISRTHKLLEQYDRFLPNDAERYEITLRLNTCVGLLFVGRQYFERSIPAEALENIGLTAHNVRTCKNNAGRNESINTRTVSRHLRNAIAHARFEFINENGVVKSIRFRDKSDRVGETFDMTLNCEEFVSLTEWYFHVFN